MQVKELSSSTELRIGLIGSLFVFVWEEAATVEGLDRMERIQADHAQALGTFSTLSIVQLRHGRFSGPGVREKAADMSQRFDAHLRASAMVMSGDGLSVSVARAFMVGFRLVSRQRVPVKSYRTIDEACTYLRSVAHQTKDLVEMDGLTEAVKAFAAPRPAA